MSHYVLRILSTREKMTINNGKQFFKVFIKIHQQGFCWLQNKQQVRHCISPVFTCVSMIDYSIFLNVSAKIAEL
jgi:hypothetical protein